MTRRSRIWLLGAGCPVLIIGLVAGHPVYHLIRTALRDKNELKPTPAGFADDASRLNQTAVTEIRDIPPDPAEAENLLREFLQRAKNEKLGVSIAGARHSMGGHTICPDGIVLNMLPFNRMVLNEATSTLRVGSGALWSQIIPYLNERGFSVAVMQSNNSFSVGGSISVNCHGWQHNQPPIASTVEGFRLMKTDGTVVYCSRKENTELFRVVLGGYGLFGVILDVDLRIVPNERYRGERFIFPAERYVDTFQEKVDKASDLGMVYGRLCVVPGDKTFLREAILTTFHRSPCPKEQIPQLHKPGLTALKRTVFRGSVGDNYGKKLRWDSEKKLGEHLTGKFFSRNQLLNDGAELFEERGAGRTDILHEYFIPPGQFNAFLEHLRRIVPQHKGDLLNVTVRNVHRDTDTLLRYADQDVFAFVMLFSQKRTPEADAQMEAMTQEMIDAAIELGGHYYLPYRLHATPEQLQRAYPQAGAFFDLKRKYDPDEIFQNQFYRKYGRR